MASVINNKKENNPNVISVAQEYIRKPDGVHNLVVAPTLKVLKWAEWWLKGLSESGKQCKAILGKFSHSLMCLDIPNQIRKIHKAVFHLRKNLVAGAVREIPVAANQVFVETALTAGLLADTVEILRQDRFVTLSAAQIATLNLVGFLGSAALFVKAIQGLKKQIHKLQVSEIGSHKFKLALLRVIGKICLAAIAFFGMSAFLLGAMVSQVLVLSISTCLLTTTICSHFYEKLYIKKKQKSVEV